MGMFEPHGHADAFGLDLIKAEYTCDEAAARFGGIVAPSQTYHIHETGFHGTWLKEVVGEVNPRLGGLPPDVVTRSLLFEPAWAAIERQRPSWVSYGSVSG